MMLLMKRYECLLPVGHVGAGKYDEKKVVIHATDAVHAMNIAQKMGRVKKGDSKVRGFLSITELKN